MASSIYTVPFLNGVSFLTNSSTCQLLFRHYSYTNEEWRIINECIHPTEYTDIVSFGLHHVSGNGGPGKIPCSLCRHRQDPRRHCIIRYCPDTKNSKYTCTDGPTLCGIGAIRMINGDTLLSLDDYMTTPIDHIWQFPQPGLSVTSLIMIKSVTMLDYFESSKKGISKSKGHYIPLDYVPVIKCVTLYWEPKLSGRGLPCYTPKFIVSTSFNQLLIFEGGATSLCMPLNESVADTTVVKDSPHVLTVATLSTNHNLSLYKVTESLDKDAIYKLKAIPLRKIDGGEGCNWRGMAAVHVNGYSMEQLVVYSLSADSNLEFRIIEISQKSKVVDTEESTSTGGLKSLIEAAKSLEIKKLCKNGIIEDRRLELTRKCQVYCQAMKVLTNSSSPSSASRHIQSDLVTLTGHRPPKPSPMQTEVEEKQLLSLRHSWQRVVDEQVLAIGLLIDNPGPSVISDVSISVVPKDLNHVSTTFCCKMVSLVTPENCSLISHTVSSRTLPPQSQACFIISSEDLLPCLIGGSKAGLGADEGAGLSTAGGGDGWASIVILYKVNETITRQLGAGLSQLHWKDIQCTSLGSLLSNRTWMDDSYIIDKGSNVLDGFICMALDNPTKEEIDFSCHLGSKRLSKIQLVYQYHHYSLHTAVDELISKLPFVILGDNMATPTHSKPATPCLCPGVCISYEVAKHNVLTITVLHRSVKELDIVKNWIKSLLVNKWTFRD